MRARAGLATLAAAALAGCGATDEERAKETVRDYLQALADGNSRRACDRLTPDAQRRLEASWAARAPGIGATSCPELVELIADTIAPEDADRLTEVEFERVTVEGDRATVRPRGASEDAQLIETDNAGWLISGGLEF